MQKNREPQRFNPELDGQGRVLAPVKKKYLPKPIRGDSALGSALRQAMAKGSERT